MSATAILWLVQSLVALVFLIVIAMILGGKVKSGTVDRIQDRGRLYSAIILILFSWGVCSAIMFAYSAHLDWMGRLYSVVTIILMLPFYLGATFVTSGDLKYRYGGLVIAKGSLLNRVLFDWLGFSRSREWNLCNISWLGALMIICVPIFSSFVSVFLLIVGLVRFFIVGESPHRAFCRAFARDEPDDIIFDSPKTIRVFGRRFFPILWIGFGLVILGLFRTDKIISWLKVNYLSILIPLGLLGFVITAVWIWDLVGNHLQSVRKAVPEEIESVSTGVGLGTRAKGFLGTVGSRVKQKAQHALEPLRPIQALWLALKKKRCPRVIPES